MKNELEKMYDSIRLSDEADARIQQALLRRSASEQEVTPMKPKKHPIRTLLIAAALVAVLAIAATAVANTYFIPTVQSDLAAADTLQGALGDNIAGHEAFALDLIDEDGNVAKTEYYPTVERVALDEALADELLGGYVYAGTESITLGGCELNVASLMLDESGIGIVTVDIDFPSADMVPEAYTPCLSFYSGSLTEGKEVETGASGELGALHGLDCADYLDETQSTDTHIRYVCYITPFDCADEAGDLVMQFRLIDQVYDAVTGEYTGEGEWYIALSAPELIPAQHYSGDGFEAWVSPIGMKLETAGEGERSIHEFVLHYADGSNYIVISNEQSLHNTAVSSLCHDHNHQFHAFNRLADTASLATIELDGTALTAAK